MLPEILDSSELQAWLEDDGHLATALAAAGRLTAVDPGGQAVGRSLAALVGQPLAELGHPAAAALAEACRRPEPLSPELFPVGRRWALGQVWSLAAPSGRVVAAVGRYRDVDPARLLAPYDGPDRRVIFFAAQGFALWRNRAARAATGPRPGLALAACLRRLGLPPQPPGFLQALLEDRAPPPGAWSAEGVEWRAIKVDEVVVGVALVVADRARPPAAAAAGLSSRARTW
jgi:hypothetical protein